MGGAVGPGFVLLTSHFLLLTCHYPGLTVRPSGLTPLRLSFPAMPIVPVKHALGEYEVHIEPGILLSLPELFGVALG